MHFSIIIPTYNRAFLLQKLLTTLVAQTYLNFEVIIVDDGGNDDSELIVKGFNDQRFRYFKKENGGVSSARNFGLLHAKGEYINFFDSDDLAYPNHLQEAYNFFISNQNANVIIFDYEWGNIDKSKYKIITNKYKDLNSAIIKENFISTNSIFIKKTSADKLRFNEKLTISEDWEFWLKLSFFNKFYAVNTVTTYIVEHQQRGINRVNINHLINQNNIFINALDETKLFNNSQLKIINSHFCSLIALNAALVSNKKIAISYFIKSVQFSKKSIFSKRSLAIIKHLLIK